VRGITTLTVGLALALGVATPVDAQSVAEIESLRQQVASQTGGLDRATLERAEAMLGGRDGLLDSLRTDAEQDARSRLLPPDVPPTEPVRGEESAEPGVVDDDELPAFGYDLFLSAPDGYVPPDLGPVDDGYVLGPGDEVVVQLWGATELVQSVTVDREGRGFVKDVGLVPLAGRTLAAARRDLKLRLQEIHSGLRDDGERGPSISFDLGIAKLRTVQVFVLGEVARPGAYRVPANGSVLDLLYRAGGARESGSLRRITVIRRGEPVATFDLYRALLAGDLTSDTRLQTGDVVHVPPVGMRVELRGEVFRPARYEVLETESFSDVVAMAGGLEPTALLDRATVQRVVSQSDPALARDYGYEILTVSTSAILGETPFALRDGDRIQVERIPEETGGYVETRGAGFYRPGRVAFEEGLTLEAVIDRSGGLRPEAVTREVQIARTLEDRSEEQMSVNLELEDPRLALRDRDVITIHGKWDFAERDSVTVVGHVRRPGKYPLREGLTLQDMLFMAGGLREDAYHLVAEVSRIHPAPADPTELAHVFKVPIEGWQDGSGDAATFVLHRHDEVHVRPLPGFELQRDVRIEGEVRFPGTYTLSRSGERVTDLIRRAGGLLPTAYADAAVFTREKDEAGRIALDLASALDRPGDRTDLVLEEGDVLLIPQAPHTVKVVGEVGFPSSVLYREGKGVSFYLERAGGLTQDADGDRVLVQRASGEIEHGTGGFLSSGPEIDPGTVIYVPKKEPEKGGSRLRDIADIVNVVAGAATTIFLIHEVTQ